MTDIFPWSQEQFYERFRRAVRSFWMGRIKQSRKQKKYEKDDAGTRGEVTGGQHLNAFALLLVDVIKAAGIPPECIFFQKPLVLPGYYRAQKKWDIAVFRDGHLLAAIRPPR